MTDREKAIVMAYTGVAMLVGDKLDLFYKYLAELFDRPVYTHELVTQEMTDKIKEKSKPDFIKLCRETTEPIKHGYFVKSKNFKGVTFCSECRKHIDDTANYCEWCGARMDGDENEKA